MGNPVEVTYGSKANDPLTWDADMVYGCQPDYYGYSHGAYSLGRIAQSTGSALDGLMCPYGYDARAIGMLHNTTVSVQYVKEVQQISCTASTGYFTLAFRGFVTRAVHANDSAKTLQARLQELPSIGLVNISINSFATVCSPGVSVVYVTFLTEFGGLPLLAVQQNALLFHSIYTSTPTISISRYQTSLDRGFYECSAKGQCDRTTGECQCWDHWGTSDGTGGLGTRGDCGHSTIS